MNWFPLPLFPEGSLASSVVTTVWVGVVVISFMNLRFGWVFSGLVVPGYLVPLLIVKPWAAGVVLVEVALTYLLVYALTVLLPRFNLGCAFFGRDRFLAMIVISACLRMTFDLWLLPGVAGYLDQAFGLAFDYQNNLHSFGLIVTCLAANQLWKTGLVRGLFPFAFSLLVTFLFVRYVLMTCTNFSISNLSFLYEDIATSIYAAPKAYIVLITTALLASRMNLKYGWDFNGIMIPALIALQWYEPLKILTSFVEALVILGLAHAALQLPVFRAMTMEGARKMLLFFSISYGYKMAIGFFLPMLAPEVKVSDFYGFGYLLPTLIAVKMYDQHKIVHQVRITVQISLVSVVVSNAIGYGLTRLPLRGTADVELARLGPTPPWQTSDAQVVERIREMYMDGHAGFFHVRSKPPDVRDQYVLDQGLAAMERFLKTNRPSDRETARMQLGAAGYTVELLGKRYVLVHPIERDIGRVMLLLDRQPEKAWCVQVPRALEEPGMIEAALDLFMTTGARSLVMGGLRDRPSRVDYGIPQSWLEVFYHRYGLEGTIEFRSGHENRLQVKRALPAELDLAWLEQRFGSYAMDWSDEGEPNRIREIARGPFASLFLSSDAIIHGEEPASPVQLDQPLDAYLRACFSDPAPRASGRYRAPDRGTLLYLDRHVLSRLFTASSHQLPTLLIRLRRQVAARGYELRWIRTGEIDHVLLVEHPQQRTYWGGFCLRITPPGDGETSVCIQVPSRGERAALLSLAADAYKQRPVRLLLVAGSNALTNPDGSANLGLTENAGSLFNLVHQRLLQSEPHCRILQLRAFNPAPGEAWPEADLIIAPQLDALDESAWASVMKPQLEFWRTRGLAIQLVGEADETSPYSVGFNLQARYAGTVGNAPFALCWVSPALRDTYGARDLSDPVFRVLRALEIPVREDRLGELLAGARFAPPEIDRASLKTALRRLRTTGEPQSLVKILAQYPAWRFTGVLDEDSAQAFLVCRNAENEMLLVANLARGAFERPTARFRGSISAFIDGRAAWLEGGD